MYIPRKLLKLCLTLDAWRGGLRKRNYVQPIRVHDDDNDGEVVVEGFGLNTSEMMSRGKLFYLLVLQGQYRIKIVGEWIFMFQNKRQFALKVGKGQFKSPKGYFGSYTRRCL